MFQQDFLSCAIPPRGDYKSPWSKKYGWILKPAQQRAPGIAISPKSKNDLVGFAIRCIPHFGDYKSPWSANKLKRDI